MHRPDPERKYEAPSNGASEQRTAGKVRRSEKSGPRARREALCFALVPVASLLLPGASACVTAPWPHSWLALVWPMPWAVGLAGRGATRYIRLARRAWMAASWGSGGRGGRRAARGAGAGVRGYGHVRGHVRTSFSTCEVSTWPSLTRSKTILSVLALWFSPICTACVICFARRKEALTHVF